jgi:hypothetical protein
MDISLLFNPGLYKMTCLKNKKIYIGQSSNVLSRLGRHVDNLEKNRHDCLALQKDFNKYGKVHFLFNSLKLGNEYIDENFRKKMELHELQIIPAELQYNKSRGFETPFFPRSIQVNEKKYKSLNQAARELKESRTHLVRKCLSKKNLNYNFIETWLTQKYAFKSSQPCRIDNKNYSSLNEAGKDLNLNHKTIKNRILSKKYPNYAFS